MTALMAYISSAIQRQRARHRAGVLGRGGEGAEGRPFVPPERRAAVKQLVRKQQRDWILFPRKIKLTQQVPVELARSVGKSVVSRDPRWDFLNEIEALEIRPGGWRRDRTADLWVMNPPL